MNGQTVGYAQMQAAPQPPSTLYEFQNDIGAAVKELVVLREQARAIADSVFGVTPTATMSTSGTTAWGNELLPVASVAPPKAASIRASLADLRGTIATLRTEIERLSCI